MLLARAYLERVDLARHTDLEALDAVLGALVSEASAVWPDVALAPEAFVAHVARHWDADPVDRWPRRHAADLWLACACARRVERAADRFDERHGEAIDRVLGRMRLARDLAADVKQLVRTKLLVADGDAPPRIDSYSGRGELAAWVRAVATRVALNVIRDEPREDGDAELMQRLPAAGEDPELRLLKTRYAAEFRAALTDAIATLDARSRLVLKQHYVDGLSTEELGALHGVHRVTVLRWLVGAREQVAEEAQRRLGASIGATATEIESIARLVRSQLDLSLHDCIAAS